MVQNKITCKVIKGEVSDVFKVFGSIGYEPKKTFHRKGYYYHIPQTISSRLIVVVQIYQLFESNDSEIPLQSPGMWIVEAKIESNSKEGLIDAEHALKNISNALSDLVNLQNLNLKTKF